MNMISLAAPVLVCRLTVHTFSPCSEGFVFFWRDSHIFCYLTWLSGLGSESLRTHFTWAWVNKWQDDGQTLAKLSVFRAFIYHQSTRRVDTHCTATLSFKVSSRCVFETLRVFPWNLCCLMSIAHVSRVQLFMNVWILSPPTVLCGSVSV